MHKRNDDRIEIRSSDGWNVIEFQLTSNSDVMHAEITSRGRFWNRAEDFDLNTTELVDDFDLKLFQSKLSRSKVGVLKDSLESWMLKPYLIDINLSEEGLPQIGIIIGEAEDFICSTFKPVFAFNYKDSRIHTTIKFVVDQSCLKLFLEGLKRSLLH